MVTGFLIAHASELITGTFTLLAGIAGSAFLYKQNLDAKRIEMEAEDRRTSAEYILEKEADGLIDLLEAAEDAYIHSQEYAREAQSDFQPDEGIVQDTNKAMDKFERSLRVNRVFLNEKLENDAKSLLGSTRFLIDEYTGPSFSQKGDAPKSTAWKELHADFDMFIESIGDEIRGRTNALRQNDTD